MLYGRTQYGQPSRFISEMPQELLESNISESRRVAVNDDPEPMFFRQQAMRSRYFSAVENTVGIASTAKEDPALDFAIGDSVIHKAFGEGLVVSVKPMGGDALLEIAFNEKGTKRLMAKSAGQFMRKT